MSRLLRAELCKVFTTKLWWVLLIPISVIAGVIGFTGAAIAGLPAVLEETGTTAPAVALTVPISMKQATVFAVILGLIGGAGEFRHKTITTSYLTGSSRGAVLAAKAITYAGLGLLYGVATFACCALGALASSGTDSFPSAADTMIVAAAGCAGVTLWTVLGVGIGTLISNQIVVLILVLVYTLFFEGLLSLVLRIPRLGLDGVARLLPGAGSEALQTGHGISAFAKTFGDEAYVVREGSRRWSAPTASSPGGPAGCSSPATRRRSSPPAGWPAASATSPDVTTPDTTTHLARRDYRGSSTAAPLTRSAARSRSAASAALNG